MEGVILIHPRKQRGGAQRPAAGRSGQRHAAWRHAGCKPNSTGCKQAQTARQTAQAASSRVHDVQRVQRPLDGMHRLQHCKMGWTMGGELPAATRCARTALQTAHALLPSLAHVEAWASAQQQMQSSHAPAGQAGRARAPGAAACRGQCRARRCTCRPRPARAQRGGGKPRAGACRCAGQEPLEPSNPPAPNARGRPLHDAPAPAPQHSWGQ